MSIFRDGSGRTPFVSLLAGVLVLGIADSMIGPYLVLFGADRAELSPLQVGVFMSVISVSGLAVSTWLGRRYRAALLLCGVLAAVGFVLLAGARRLPAEPVEAGATVDGGRVGKAGQGAVAGGGVGEAAEGAVAGEGVRDAGQSAVAGGRDG